MKKKIVGIFVCMLLITTGANILIMPEKMNVKADPVGREGENNNYLNFTYMWDTVTNLANIIHDESIYGSGEIKKGRYFGSNGDKATAARLFENFTETCGFHENDVQKVALKHIDGTGVKYTDFVEVTSYQLEIDYVAEFPFNPIIPEVDHSPVAAVRPEAGKYIDWDCSMDRTFNEVDVINKLNFNLDFSKWETGINEKNTSFNTLNDCDIVLGNLTYVAPENNVPDYQNFETVFLFDEVEGVVNKIENATNSSAVILISESSKSYHFEDALEYMIPIVNISSDEGNITTIKQYLENDTRVIVDSMIFDDKLTFIHDMSDPLCWPDEEFVIVYNRSRDHPIFNNQIKHVERVWKRNAIHQDARCRGVIFYDIETDECHNVYVQNINGIRMGTKFPLYALPGFGVNQTIGRFLWDNDDEEDNTISGHIHQTHHKETPEDPGVEAYNIEAYINITESPNDAVVVISSRYDSMWNECPGDSGAGNGIIMGIAEYMQRLNQSGVTPKYNITFLMTTNEENGMYGAQFFNDSHPTDNIKMWIGTDQLGFNTGYLHNVYRNHAHRDICENISILLGYEDKTEYKMWHNTTDHEDYLYDADGKYGKMGVGAEDVVFYERNSPYECETILIHKDDFPKHHRRGLGLTDGDVLDNIDDIDVNMFYNISWDIVKYFNYNPNCWFEEISYTPIDSPDDGDTLDDSINVSFTIASSLPHDTVMLKVNLSKYTGDPPTLTSTVPYTTLNYTITDTDNERYFIFTIPDDENKASYSFDLYLYNSTGRIDDIVDSESNNVNDTDSSTTIDLYHPFGTTTEGSLEQNVLNRITGSVFTTNEYGTADDINIYMTNTPDFPAPKFKAMIYRKNDYKLVGTTEEKTVGKASAGWVKLDFQGTKPILIKDTEYVLTVWGDSTKVKINYNTWDTARGRYDYHSYGTPPPTADFTNENRLHSIYCSYTPDTSPPEISDVSSTPVETGYYDSAHVFYTNITADVTDDVAGVDTVNVTIYDPDNELFLNETMNLIGSNTYWYNVTLQDETLGIYNYSIWATDNASNGNTSDTYNFTVSLCGDADSSGNVDLDDVVFLIAYIFSSGPPPQPLCRGDADGSGNVDIDDVNYLIAFIFSGGPAPVDDCCPFD